MKQKFQYYGKKISSVWKNTFLSAANKIDISVLKGSISIRWQDFKLQQFSNWLILPVLYLFGYKDINGIYTDLIGYKILTDF